MHRRPATYSFLFLFSAFCFLLTSCAQIVIPSGGKKDVIPPQVEKYIPDSAAVNFTAKSITIAFKEYIQLTDLQKELTISPPMNIQPEISVKGKMLHIELKDSLKSNTTYVLNFGSSIRDFTEGNARADFRYIFSTGDHIDTLQLTGTVKNAYDQKTDKGILVMLYESFDDSVPYKKGPSYFAKTNADGTYKISNIRPGKYKAFALKDANGNYKYDVPTESIGFSDTLIKISKNTKLDLKIFQEEPKRQFLLKKYTKGYGRMELIYAKPLKSVRSISYKALNQGTKTETFLTEFNYGLDSIRIWFPYFSQDSLCFKVIADENTIDTIKIGTAQFKRDNEGRGAEFTLTTTTNVRKDKPFDLNKAVEIRFNNLIKEDSLRPRNVYGDETWSKILIKQDSAKYDSCQIYTGSSHSMGPKVFDISDALFIRKEMREVHLTQPTHKDSMGMVVMSSGNMPWQENTPYSIFIPPGTITDIFGLTNDSIKINFTTQEQKFYGTLKMSLKINNKVGHVLELVNEKGVVFEETPNEKNYDKGIFFYEYLPPGAYKLRLIYDENEDGKWTTGDYLQKRKPENIIYYPGAVTIRSNWDLELDWKVE